MRASISLFLIPSLVPLAFAAAAETPPRHLAVANEPSGAVAVRDGEKTIASFVPKTAAKQRGSASVDERQVAGHAVIQVRIPVLGQDVARDELWVGERSGGGAKVIWWGLTGALDPDGETATTLAVDGTAIRLFQTAARLSRCDGLPVPLAAKTWDFATHGFRAEKPALPAAAATSIKAHRGGAPEGKPLGGFFFSAASSSPGSASDPGRLRPPAALNDDNPGSVWSSDGDAAGQLLTARSSGGFPITGLRLLPGDPGNERSYRASSRPRKLALIFDKNPAHDVDVELVEDADGGSRRAQVPFWIALPKPVASACVTVVVREATSDKVPVSIADLDVMTELDGMDAADRLIASLAGGVGCAARQALLPRLGPAVVPKLASAVAKTSPGPGRECLVEALAAALDTGVKPTPEVGPALASAIAGATASEEKIILAVLPGLPEPPLASVSALLRDEKRAEPDRLRAARVLSALPGDDAARALLAAVGHGGASARKALRAAAAALKPPAARLAKEALQATPSSEPGRRADLLLVFATLAQREPAVRPEAVATLGATLDGPASFEEQARAIAGLGLLKDPAGLARLDTLRGHNPDGVLRYLASLEIAASDDASALPALRAALDDVDPRVREIAAAGLGQRHDKAAADALIAGAKQEPWINVRRAEVMALGQLCIPAGDELLQRALKRDVDDVRQAALVGIAHCYGAKATPALLAILGRLPESADMRSLAARLLAERKDPATVRGLSEALARLVTEVEGDMSLQTVIVDAAMALATIHTPEAISALVTLLSKPSVPVRRAGIEALGIVCDPGAGEAALQAAAKDKDEAVSIPAATAAAHCRQSR